MLEISRGVPLREIRGEVDALVGRGSTYRYHIWVLAFSVEHSTNSREILSMSLKLKQRFQWRCRWLIEEVFVAWN